MNLLEAIATEARASSAKCGSVRLLLIDGPAGSGKTTFAGHLSSALGKCPIVSMDDLYAGWIEPLKAELYQRINEQIIQKLKMNEPVKFQRFNWHLNVFDDWREIIATDFLIIEGVGSMHPELAKNSSLKIWLESKPKSALRRVLSRDGDQIAEQMNQWQKMEQQYFAKFHIADQADFSLSTD